MIAAWLHARSLSRGLPLPVPDHGGWRVDTGSASETRRHVFTAIGPGLRDLGAATTEPRVFVKLTDTPAALLAVLPPRWRIDSVASVMAGPMAPRTAPLPPGYRIEVEPGDTVVVLRILAPDGGIAASGRSARHDGVFIYDQIVTAEPHRRRGLGRVVMATLGSHRREGEREILTATADGEALYTTLGWTVVSPWSTAVLPAQ
ncbi:GNAT family N-acetyltransferase [Polymorphobacter sp. PAMC 29334]|uniref:GNAT family N-acetyltransferase n=1 Tax=Polymorphobacter sp. PAMC 29334 TaxID=2862331 RepID=UPI001C790982|nr:GNAT family N-acetyltransferase [Polymorphobacter sp. PAMC 29334]QYE34804.1 GNAT family N-acetyltransferase [Polymorphobacter sp. PAMC 29334]